MKQNAEQESSLLYWEIQDDTTRKHQSLKQTLFFVVCFLMAGFGLYQMVKETPVVGVGSMNELEVGSAPRHYEVESAVGATTTVNDGEEIDLDEETFVFNGKVCDAEELCEKYECGPDQGACLFLPKDNGSPECEIDPGYYTSKPVCNYDKGVWCVGIYRETEEEENDLDEDDDEVLAILAGDGEEMSADDKPKVQVPPGVELAVAGGLAPGVYHWGYNGQINLKIQSADWCDCRKKGQLEVRAKRHHQSFFIPADNQWKVVSLGKKTSTVMWKCTGGGGWGQAKGVQSAYIEFQLLGFSVRDFGTVIGVKFHHGRKRCGFKRRRSGRMHWK